MRVLGIVCSPRKDGNTEILVREALAAAQEAGCETEIILVANKNIGPCDACAACIKTGVCKTNDDMQGIYEAMEKADAIVFGTPSYFSNVSAQAKAIMDRTYAFLFTRKLRGKVGGAIVVARRIGIGQILGIMYSFFNVHRMVIAGGSAGIGMDKGDVREGPGGGPGSRAIDEARALGKSVVRMATQMAK
jgi:multimeric flavodoxin WrbA